MKFEYELNYDFVTGELRFKITKMPESLRGFDEIKKIDIDGTEWVFRSRWFPAIGSDFKGTGHQIFLRGSHKYEDYNSYDGYYKPEEVFQIARALKLFQEWVEEQDDEVVMTVSEIEKKLGIKNLKIVKEK